MNDTHCYAIPPNARRAEDVLAEIQAAEQKRLERAQARAVTIPDGEITTEMLAKIARENTGAAFNTYVELMEDKETPPAVRKACADAITDRGHGKVANDQDKSTGNITVVIQRFASDEAITINGQQIDTPLVAG